MKYLLILLLLSCKVNAQTLDTAGWYKIQYNWNQGWIPIRAMDTWPGDWKHYVAWVKPDTTFVIIDTAGTLKALYVSMRRIQEMWKEENNRSQYSDSLYQKLFNQKK